MYSEYNTRPISSHPVTTRTEKCSGYFAASKRGSAQVTGWLRRISRRYRVVSRRFSIKDLKILQFLLSKFKILAQMLAK